MVAQRVDIAERMIIPLEELEKVIKNFESRGVPGPCDRTGPPNLKGP